MSYRFFLVLATFIAGNAVASPFDVEMGTTAASLDKVTKGKLEDKFYYSAKSLPGGHPDFKDYGFIVTPGQGVCKTMAFTPSIKAGAFGTDAKSKFDDLLAALTKKYGKPKNVNDFLRQGSIWKEPRYWMMGLYKKERVLSAYWEPKGSQDHLNSIFLEGIAQNAETAVIQIGYEFENFSKCRDEIKSTRDSKL